MINPIRKKVLKIDNFNSQLSALIENEISQDRAIAERRFGGTVPWHSNGITFVEITVDDLLHSPHFEKFLRNQGLDDLIKLVEQYKLHSWNHKIADLDDQDEKIINQHKENKNNVKKNIVNVLGMSGNTEIISCKTMQKDKTLDYHNAKVPFYSHHIAQLDLMINMSGNIKEDLKAIRPELVDIVKYHTLMAEITHRQLHYPVMSHNTPKLKKQLKTAYDNYLHNIGGEKEAHYRRAFKRQLIKTNQDVNRLTIAADPGLNKQAKRDRRRELNRDLAGRYKAIHKAIKNDCRKVALSRRIIGSKDKGISDKDIRKFEVGDSPAKGHIAAESNKHHYVTFHHPDGKRRTQSGTTSDSTSHNRKLQGKLAITFIETDNGPDNQKNEFGLYLLQTPSLSAIPKGKKNFDDKETSISEYKNARIVDIKNNKMKQIEDAIKKRNPDFDLNHAKNHIMTVDLTSPGSDDESENHQDLSFKCDTQAVHLFNAEKLVKRKENNDNGHPAPALARVILSYGINGADFSSEDETDLMNAGASLLLLYESLKDCPDTSELKELREIIAEVLIEFNDEYEKYLNYLITTTEPMHEKQSFAENSNLNAEHFLKKLPPLGSVPVNNLKALNARQRMALVFYKVVQSGKYNERRNRGQTLFFGRDRRGRIMQAMASALAGDKSNPNVLGHFHCKSNLDRGKENGDYALALSRGGINKAIDNCLIKNRPDLDRDLRWLEKALNNSVERNGADGSIFQQQSSYH